ncbi:hypothetical protein BDZ45DRAFT_743859 [Acephala macrosclerotiorum]|nr:hypothetical protein BDZ45DRAFT_743859 [Acephala macrosclerotiorum]
MVQTRKRKLAKIMGEAQTKRTKVETTREDLQANLAAEYPEDEDRSTQNAEVPYSNIDKEASSRASSLSPPPEVIEEPEWAMEQDRDQQNRQGQQEQQGDDAEDTIVVDTSARTIARSPDQGDEQPRPERKKTNTEDTTVSKLDAKAREDLWKTFERPTSLQIQDYVNRGGKYPFYSRTALVDFRVKTACEHAVEAAKEAERKRLEEIISNPKMFDQNGLEWPYRKIYIRPASKPYEKPPFWVEARDIPEWIEYCKYQRKFWENKLKIDKSNGGGFVSSGGAYCAESNGHIWRIVKEVAEEKEGNDDSITETWGIATLYERTMV